MEIKLDTVNVSKTVNSLKSSIQKIDKYILEMKQITNSDMHNHWKGSDYEEGFLKKINPFLEEELMDYKRSIDYYQKYLQNYFEHVTIVVVDDYG